MWQSLPPHKNIICRKHILAKGSTLHWKPAYIWNAPNIQWPRVPDYLDIIWKSGVTLKTRWGRGDFENSWCKRLFNKDCVPNARINLHCPVTRPSGRRSEEKVGPIRLMAYFEETKSLLYLIFRPTNKIYPIIMAFIGDKFGITNVPILVPEKN